MQINRKTTSRFIIPKAAWMDERFDSRFMVCATNTSGVDLEDALVQVTISVGASFTTSTVRVVDVHGLGGIDSHLSRYKANRAPNSFYYVPVSVEGSILTIKALGKWLVGERRYWGVYWNTTTTPTSYSYNHLATAIDTSSPPTFYSVQRVGPNTDTGFSGANVTTRMPYGSIFPYNNVGLYVTDQSYQFMFANYFQGGIRYGFTSATLDSIDLQNCFVRTTGTLNDPNSFITGSYTATIKNHIFTTPYSDDSGKWATLSTNTVHLTLTTTVKNSFLSSNQNFFVFRLWDSNASGQTLGTNGTMPFFYQYPNGILTNVNATSTGGAELLPIETGLVMGSSMGNASIHTFLMRVDAFSYTGFGSATTKGLVVFSDSLGFSIGFTDVNGQIIPEGATVNLELTLMPHFKNATPGPDTLVPVEAIRVLKSADVVQGIAAPAEKFTSGQLERDIEHLSGTLINGVKWIQSNAPNLTRISWNYAFAHSLIDGTTGVSDDDDSTYGQAHVLHGLCLRWRRTHDKELVPLIENAVNYFIQLNALAERSFSSDPGTLGMMPYWVFSGVTTGASATYTESAGTQWQRTITYQNGQPRQQTSLEQMQMSTHALWAYLTMCTDTTLFMQHSLVISLLERMQQFEQSSTNGKWRASVYGNDAWTIGNALHLATNGQFGSVTNNGGTDSVQNTVTGNGWGWNTAYQNWMINNKTNYANFSDSNRFVIGIFHILFAPDSTNQGILKYVEYASSEILTSDMSLHPVVTDSSTASFGSFIDEYPVGWRPLETTLILMYDATKNPSHYILCNDAGARDDLFGKEPHYAMVLGFCALFNPTYACHIDESTGATISSYDVFIRSLHTGIVHLIEPSTNVGRRGLSRFFGAGSKTMDALIDNCDLGYLLMAVELYYLVKSVTEGLNPSEVYRFPGTYVAN